MKAVFSAGLLLAGLLGVNGEHHMRSKIRSNFGEKRVLEIAHEHLTPEAIQILHKHGVDHFGSDEHESHFRIEPEVVRKLKESSIKFRDSTEEWIAEMEELFSDDNFVCHGEDCAKRNLQDFYSTYQTLDVIHQRARDLVADVDFAEISSIGKSYEGRDQLSVNIGDQSKPLVFYFCNIHAREWLTPMYCSYMVEMLVADGGHPLLDTFSFTVVLSANPDGYAYTHSNDNMWRKTRKPNKGSSCVGTDPNRNYDSFFCGPGTSNSPCSDVYCGTEPFSEVEVANIRDFAMANADRLIATNDVHAYGYLWMFPYGGIQSDPAPADFAKMDKCSRAAITALEAQFDTTWTYGPVWSAIYSAAGTSVDWFYDSMGVVYPFTAEVRGRSFQPATSNIMPSNIEIFAGMTASLNCVAEEENLTGGSVAHSPTVAEHSPTPFPTQKCNNVLFC